MKFHSYRGSAFDANVIKAAQSVLCDTDISIPLFLSFVTYIPAIPMSKSPFEIESATASPGLVLNITFKKLLCGIFKGWIHSKYRLAFINVKK